MRVLNRFLFVFAALCLLFSASFAQGFEGTMTMQLIIPQLGGTPIPISVTMKGDKSVSVTNFPMMGESKVYADMTTMKNVVVQGGGKIGHEIDMSKVAEQAQSQQDSIGPVAAGQKKMINGYPCELYTMAMKEGTMQIWMTSDFPKDITAAIGRSLRTTMGGMRGGRGGASNGMKELLNKGLAPVETNVVKDGTVQATIDFVKYERKSVDEKDVTIPADITIEPVQNMMGGSGGPGGH